MSIFHLQIQRNRVFEYIKSYNFKIICILKKTACKMSRPKSSYQLYDLKPNIRHIFITEKQCGNNMILEVSPVLIRLEHKYKSFLY